MSFGDEIIASGHALAVHRRHGSKVRICGQDGRQRWSDLWAGLDWIVQPGELARDAIPIRNGPGCRPYIRYPFTLEGGCRYSGWRCRDHVGAIAFTPTEMAFADAVSARLGAYIVIEPEIAPRSNPNKQWGRQRWQALADLLRPHFRLVQLGPAGTQRLSGVAHVETASFRLGAAVLSRAAGAVLPEGGLHHAAAALRVAAVVLFGGAVDASAMGYPWHDNIVDDGPGSPCGKWTPCPHCAAIWEALAPETVAARASALFSAVRPASGAIPMPPLPSAATTAS